MANTSPRKYHTHYADYYWATAGDVWEHDGIRLVPTPGRGIPFELVRSLVVDEVSRIGGIIAVSFRDRASFVSNTIDVGLFDLPAAGEPAVSGVWVMNESDPILIRG